MVKNIVLYVNYVPGVVVDNLAKLATPKGEKVRVAVIGNAKDSSWQKTAEKNGIKIIIPTDLNNPLKITKALMPYQGELLAITCRNEAKMDEFAKIIPHVPYLKTPTAKSLYWASDKIVMRERLCLFNKKITPKFTIVKNTTSKTLKEVKNKLTFPVMIKPSGLAGSRLVTISYHQEEFEQSLKKVFRKLNSTYKQGKVAYKPKVLVEEFMEGSMYSVDAYVNSRGRVYFCPMVYIKTGKDIGFDDFFGYMQLCPTQLKPDSVEAAQKVATQAVHALGLRNTSAHIEFIRTEDGWKIIEIGARVGGFRHLMYENSFGFSHSNNDVGIHIPQTPTIKKTIKGYTVALKFFAKKEGMLESINGIKKIKELKSLIKFSQIKKVGDRCHFAKNGGKSVVNIVMFNKNRSALFADIRRVEQTLKIIVE